MCKGSSFVYTTAHLAAAPPLPLISGESSQKAALLSVVKYKAYEI